MGVYGVRIAHSRAHMKHTHTPHTPEMISIRISITGSRLVVRVPRGTNTRTGDLWPIIIIIIIIIVARAPTRATLSYTPSDHVRSIRHSIYREVRVRRDGAVRGGVSRARERERTRARAREISRGRIATKIRREDRAVARVVCVVRASRGVRGARDGWGKYVRMCCWARRRGGAGARARERGRWGRG